VSATSSRSVAAAARRRRRFTLSVLAVAALAVVAAIGGVLILVSRGGTPILVETPYDPLLPGAPTVTVPVKAPAAAVTGIGFDVSYPQCRSTLPKTRSFGIVGVNGGAPLTSNACFAEQVAWAKGSTAGYAVYVNTSYSGKGDPVAYGRKLIDDAIEREHAAGVTGTSMWWLDVELMNTWAGTQQENATVLASMAARLQESGVRVGIYSSPAQFEEIAGGWEPGLPVWNATGPGTSQAAADACSESFAGSSSALVQWVQKSGSRLLDHNLVCPEWKNRAGDILDVSKR
jgi:hypothetical protein